MSPSRSSVEPLFSHPAASQTTLLSRFPPEIREAIYSEILPQDAIFYPNVQAIFRAVSNHESGSRKFKSHENALALARTCQSFYTELSAFYFRTKTLSFGSAYDLYRYLYMIGPYRRQLVQNVDFNLRAGLGDNKTTRTDEVYEWMCEMLCECVSLRRLGVGVSRETNDYDGPVRGLDALRGMGLLGLQVRVREIDVWPDKRFPDAEHVWELPLVGRKGEFRFFHPEAAGKLEERLRRYMQAEGNEIKLCNGGDNSNPSLCKLKGKRRVSNFVGNRRKKTVKTGKVKKGSNSM